MQSIPIPTSPAPGAPWPVPAAARYLGVSTRHLFRLMAGRQLRSITLGRRRFVPDAEVKRLAAEGC